MSYPEIAYSRLKEGVIPLVYPRKPLSTKAIERVKRRERFRRSMFSSLRMVKPLAMFKTVSVSDLSMSGYRAVFRDAYICEAGDTLSFLARFTNNTPSVAYADCTHRVDGVRKKVTVLFMPRAVYEIEHSLTVEEPKNFTQYADVVRFRIFKSDEATKSYPVGLFDWRPKPVAEYPVAGADNAELLSAYDWSIKNWVYEALPFPSGLSIDMMSVSFPSGWLIYRGRVYKDPEMDNSVRITWRVVNMTGSDIDVEHWGLPLSVFYEDNIHISQINVDVSFPRRTIRSGATSSFSLEFNLPDWAYGRIAPAEAMNFYSAGRLIAVGGPVFQFECGRLRMP